MGNKATAHLLWIKLQLMGLRFETKKEMMHELKQYNNFQMRISERVDATYKDPEDFIANVYASRHQAKLKEYQHGPKKSWLYHIKQRFNNWMRS